MLLQKSTSIRLRSLKIKLMLASICRSYHRSISIPENQISMLKIEQVTSSLPVHSLLGLMTSLQSFPEVHVCCACHGLWADLCKGSGLLTARCGV
ncbi:hypothetical protein M758_5G147900 [Ceratodon purpureus]|uniref:Uncharacterized protein n=1 Tax=Ceratodon purpureus TaxID=3225 RepID=A0A8T0I328_CERPU|nr:hypothetical protein KC19_5G154900 [Ceratodon purpureus]KAG0616872.1 hypothetical protein M758_5G147900 [Ceratodon purpureus]